MDECMVRCIGSGDRTYFWKDKWLDGNTLKDEYPEIYKLESHKNANIMQRLVLEEGAEEIRIGWDWKRNVRRGKEQRSLEDLTTRLGAVKISKCSDSWRWNAGTEGRFTVKSLREKMGGRGAHQANSNFVWLNWVPLKVNCFLWKMQQNRIPVLCNLIQRGVRVESNLCYICQQEEEGVEHLFFKCRHAMELWQWFIKWAGIPTIPTSCSSLMEVVNSLKGKRERNLTGTLLYAAVWLLWKDRNEAAFRKRRVYPMRTADEVQVISYNWIKGRGNCRWITWHDWCTVPNIDKIL